MIVKKLQVQKFRNFPDNVFSFSGNTTVIVGVNASGKTNVMEALFLLSTGKSFRARIEEEMISYDEDIARVKGSFVEEDVKSGTNLEVVLTRGEIAVGGAFEKVEKVARKRLLVNGVGKRLLDFAGTFKTVLFGPWDMDLVTGAPSIRRKLLDSLLSQVDREYRRASLSYDKGLRQRNKLLFRIREEGVARSQLLFWDKLLIKNGDYLTKTREEFIEFCNSHGSFKGHEFILEYDRSAITEARLEQYKEEEVAAATTLVGPHRDDFVFKLKSDKQETVRDLGRYGSRGEQRMGILWLKLEELAFIEEKTGQKPTLLLDDIFSELDHEHRKIVVEASKKQQTIITTADEHYIEGIEKVEVIKL